MITIDEKGNMVVISKYATPDMHLQRMKSLINLVQQRDTDFTDSETVYHALDLLEEMLPDELQMAKALK